MTIQQLLQEIVNTYVRLQPSKLHGIGVFAIRDIPKGCREMFTVDKGEWIKVPRAEAEALPQYAREMIYNYCTYDDDFYYIENSGFKKMDLSCFINHSEEPNLIPVNNGQYFEASKDIRPGEELLIDYGTIAG